MAAADNPRVGSAPAGSTVPSPNLEDYDSYRAVFSWAAARGELDGLPDDNNGLNIAHEAVDRHAGSAHRTRLAIRWISKKGTVADYTYGELSDLTNRFANVLRSLGVGKGDRVFALCGRIPELYVAALGTLKNRSVFSPLFAAFGPEPIQARMHIGEAKVLVTTKSLYERKVAGLRDSLPALQHVLLASGEGEEVDVPDTLNLRSLLAAASSSFRIEPTAPEDIALLHFTSGTTGMPKGAIHVHEAVIAHHITGKLLKAGHQPSEELRRDLLGFARKRLGSAVDSVDFYNVVLAIHAATGIEIPEVDYAKLATIDVCLDYLVAKGSTQ